MRRVLFISAGIVAALSLSLASFTFFTGRAHAAPGGSGSPASFVRSCALPKHGEAACHAIVNTSATNAAATAAATPSGFGPSDLRAAYNLPSTTAGSGFTVAIVDAYNDPNAESDLGTYRSQYGMSPCTTANGCFRKVNQTGGTSYPSSDAGWSQEISLDLDMVSAICPNCHILLVEASSSSMTDLGTAVNEAAALGANAISNSYGGSESSSDTSYDSSYFNHPGIAITVSSGDSGYGTEYPAASQYVTAVGGTSLKRDSSARGWSETVWGSSTSGANGAGSGCSAYDPALSWQQALAGLKAVCTTRAVADVAAVADPATGVAVYDTYCPFWSQFFGGCGTGWMVFGGTSVASPIIASVYALAGNTSSISNGSYPYSHTGNLFDVTSGTNSSGSSSCTTASGNILCNGAAGWDGPTGLGTPNGAGGF